MQLPPRSEIRDTAATPANSGNRVPIGIMHEGSLPAVWTGLAAQFKGSADLSRAALGAVTAGRLRIDVEFVSAAQVEMHRPSSATPHAVFGSDLDATFSPKATETLRNLHLSFVRLE